MLQPREGVAGVDRTDSLLSLESEAVPARELIIALTYKTWRSVLVGNPAPSVLETYTRMTKPQVGDLVVELTRRGSPGSSLHGFGYLIEDRVEWQHTDEQWAAEEQEAWGDERPTEQAAYVQYGPTMIDVVRWTNAMFIAVPT